MPISVFSCDLLRSLHLNGRICLSAATVFWLPRLESLRLYGVTFQSHVAFENIIRGCPVLNYLHIDMDDEIRFIISSTSLRRLELNLMISYVKLEAPSLEHIKLCGIMSVNFVQKNLSSLVEADLNVYLDDGDFSPAGYNSMVDAVSALDNAKILTLSSDVMRALSCATIKLSTDFERLVKLETRTACCRWSSLLDFIQISNNLEVLTVVQYKLRLENEHDHDHSNWTTPVEVPRCLSTSLKKVAFIGYNGFEDERDLIQYMLKHGSVLEEMEIAYHRDNIRNKSELFQAIHEFPRTSLACKVKFSQFTAKAR